MGNLISVKIKAHTKRQLSAIGFEFNKTPPTSDIFYKGAKVGYTYNEALILPNRLKYQVLKASPSAEIKSFSYEPKIAIHTNRNIESQLRGVGFLIPEYPKTGDVYYAGERVGYVDNFAGLTLPKSLKQIIKEAAPMAGIWNLL